MSIFIIATLAGCSSGTGGSDFTLEERPEPDEPKEGDATSPGCDGVTARGECRQGRAAYCDLRMDRVRETDCAGMGLKCVIDLARGAVCEDLEEEPQPPPNQQPPTYQSPCTDTNISETGFCTSGGTAVYCDTSGPSPVTRTWNCGDDGLYCGVYECAAGAYCCGEVVEEPPPSECETLGLFGACTGTNTGHYCLNGMIMDFTCAGSTTCQESVCGFGAFCCDSGEPPANECLEIGIDGICTPEGELRYCLGVDDADIVQYPCTGGETCQVDVCGEGAYCCP